MLSAFRRLDKGTRQRWGLMLLMLGGTTMCAGWYALAQGTRSGAWVLGGGLIVVYVGWVALPRRPSRTDVRNAWRSKDLFGISTRSNMAAYVATTVVFFAIGATYDWFWGAMAANAVYIVWFVWRVKR